MEPIKNIDDPRYVKAMSHPLRVRILAMLDERKASPNQMAGWLGASLGSVAYHVRTLLQLGLIELVDETRVRGAVEHHYRAKARPNVTVEGWANAPPVAKQAAVGSSLDLIGEYARVSAAAGGFDRPEALLRRALLRLDERGFVQLSKTCEKLFQQAEKIEAAAAERIARDPRGADVVQAGVGVLLFEAARLSGSNEGRRRSAGSGPGRDGSRSRAPKARKRRGAPATGSVVAGAGTEG
jgi:DNA-binding transcriptional ArsR family regulator